jgi:hypothetical protein
VHKRRNLVDHLPEEHKPAAKKKLQNAYALTEYADSRRALERLHREPGGKRCSFSDSQEQVCDCHYNLLPLLL